MSQSFDLSNNEDIKKLAIILTKHMRLQGMEGIKQSMFLEGFAKAMGVNDWNTLSAINKDHVKTVPQDNSASIAAIQFALQADEGMVWLRNWNEGEFEICRREWPESPPECYIGADQFYSLPEKDAALPLKANLQSARTSQNLPLKTLTWDYSRYIHIDNGGYTFSYNLNEEILEVTTSFFGYSQNQHRFSLSQKGILEMAKQLDAWNELSMQAKTNAAVEKNMENLISNIPWYHEGSTTCALKAFCLVLKNADTTLELYHEIGKVREVLGEIHALKSHKTTLPRGENKNVPESLFPENFMSKLAREQEQDDFNHAALSQKKSFIESMKNKESVINNMAFRYRHDLGLLPEDVIERVKNKMKVVLFEFMNGASNEQVSDKYQLYSGTVTQLREEADYQLEKLVKFPKLK